MSARTGKLVGEAGQAAGDAAGDLLESGRAGLRSVRARGQTTADGARDGAEHAVARSREFGAQAAAYIQDRPLFLGALGVALGAGLGMLIPASRSERQLLGEVGAGLRDRAEAAIRDVGSRAAEVAQSVLDSAQDAAKREGLDEISPDSLAASGRELAADASGRIQSVVEETVAAGRQAIERELSPNDRDGDTSDNPQASRDDPTSADRHRDKRFEPV